MADVTFGVKVAPDLKEKIDQLFKDSDFDTHKEWFKHLLSVYDLHQLKSQDGTKRFASDLEYIELNLTRIQETIVQMMKKTVDDVTHKEVEWAQTSLIQQQEFDKSEQIRKDLELLLIDVQGQTNKHEKDVLELQKQNSILDDLCSTLKKSLLDKETENTELKNQLVQSADYSSTIRRQSEENQSLQQQCFKQGHQIDLLRMEFEKKLEMEQLKTKIAKQDAELFLLQQKPVKENPKVLARGRGRPKKEESTESFSGLQQLSMDQTEDELKEEQEPSHLPEDTEDLIEMLKDEQNHDE